MRGLFLFAIAISAFDCNKDTPDPLPAPHPVMPYKDLPNAEVVYFKPKSVGIDDGDNDFQFGVLLIGDPVVQRDRLQYLAHSKGDTNLLNTDQAQSPVLDKGDLISTTHQGYQWFEIFAIVRRKRSRQ